MHFEVRLWNFGSWYSCSWKIGCPESSWDDPGMHGTLNDAGPAQTTVKHVIKAEPGEQYPCEWCHEQLVREVEAKLQFRTLSAKTTEIPNLVPHFTADELVDTIVDALTVPSSGQASVMSPANTKVRTTMPTGRL